MAHDFINGSAKKEIIQGNDCQVLCSAIVDLISRRQRPYLFKVTVWGEPPHAVRRIYEIGANSDTLAAQKGIDLFVKEMESPLAIFGAMM